MTAAEIAASSPKIRVPVRKLSGQNSTLDLCGHSKYTCVYIVGSVLWKLGNPVTPRSSFAAALAVRLAAVLSQPGFVRDRSRIPAFVIKPGAAGANCGTFRENANSGYFGTVEARKKLRFPGRRQKECAKTIDFWNVESCFSHVFQKSTIRHNTGVCGLPN